MRRRAFDILCVFSLIVLTLGTAAGIRSYYVGGVLYWRSAPPGPVYGLIWDEGTIGVVRIRRGSGSPMPATGWLYHSIPHVHTLTIERSAADRANVLIGRFQFVRRILPWPNMWQSETWLIVPAWAVLLASLPPIAWWRRWRRERTTARRAAFEVTPLHPAPTAEPVT